MMKRFLALGIIALFLMFPAVLSAETRCNVHLYSLKYTLEDSLQTATWTVGDADVDTSATIGIARYENIASVFCFGGTGGATHADSLKISVYGDVSWNDTTWVLADSIAVSPIEVSDLTAVSADSCYYKAWTLPTAPYFRIRAKGWTTATAKLHGWNIVVKTMRQQ